jgi:hypothetical protein
VTAWTAATAASQAVDAGASWIGLTTATTVVAARCALTRKLVGHERINVTWQLVAAWATVISLVHATIHVAIIVSVVATIVESI